MELQITREMLKHDVAQLQSYGLLHPSDELEYTIAAYRLGYTLLKYIIEEKNHFTLYDVLKKYEGETESGSIYEQIQRWYYGSFVKDAWCATGLSWAMNLMGILNATCGGKYENVYLMYQGFKNSGTREIMSVNDAVQGDVIFFKWDNEFTITAKKHVAVCTGYRDFESVEVIGCNQKDSICTMFYDIKYIVGIFRPDYTKSPLESLEELPNG